MERRPVHAPLAAALAVVGVVLAVGPAFYASFSVCGISGCSGGGFGRATDPGQTLTALVVTGIVAALPLGIYALARRSVRLSICALALGVAVTLLTALVIGSNLRGCPRDVPYETCVAESR